MIALVGFLSTNFTVDSAPLRQRLSENSALGPDMLVGDIPALIQLGSSGTQVGLAIGVTLCNNGNTTLDFFALPNADHPVLAQNLYRMSGGATNDERFEQIGQSWVAHLFCALEQNSCGFGCMPSGSCRLGPGCSDAESASLDGYQNGLGSRAWINPFTGVFPSNAQDHTGHTHTGISHRLLVEASDLSTTQNAGATYYAEAQSLTPDEYSWCQNHPGQCNMSNNVSYRRFNVTGTTSFVFTAVGPAVAMAPAVAAWPGATINPIEPAPGTDGLAFVACKVTNPFQGIWHYEYAIYNENLDRAIQSFSVPLDCASASNLSFHAPPQHPGWANDGTCNNQGYSSTPWMPNQTGDSITWTCETFVQNCNANAIRWGTLYNFRFDSDQPPHQASATIGFFKTGAPIMVQTQAPAADPCNPLHLTSIVSRKTHAAAGTFDVDLPLTGNGGVECRSTSGNHSFVFTFTNDVVSGNASVTSGTGTVSGSPIFSGNTMTVNLTGVTDQQQMAVTVSEVVDTFGQTLPDTAVNAVILAGDTNGNRVVNAADVARAKAQQGAPVDQMNFRNDVNANGAINAADVGLIKSSAGNSVP